MCSFEKSNPYFVSPFIISLKTTKSPKIPGVRATNLKAGAGSTSGSINGFVSTSRHFDVKSLASQRRPAKYYFNINVLWSGRALSLIPLSVCLL